MNRGWRVLPLVVAVVVALFSPAPLGAATTSTTPTTSKAPAPATTKNAATELKHQAEVQAKLASVQDDLEAASAEEAELFTKVAEVRAEREALDRRVAILDAQVAEVRAELAAAQARLDAVELQLEAAKLRLASAVEQMELARQALQQRAVAAYISQPAAKAAGVMLNVRSVRSLSTGQGYMEALVETQAKAVLRFRTLKEESAVLKAGLDATKEEAAGQRDLVARRTADLEAARALQDQLRTEVATKEKAQETLLAEVQKRKAAYEAQVAALERESESIAALLRSIQSGQGLVLAGNGVLANPLPGWPITSEFGMRTHPIYGTERLHAGMDIGAPPATPIRAAGDGKVVFAGANGAYGNSVIIDHGGSLATLYAHQSELFVTTGQTVQRGQTIGAVGSTGASTGPHLHFEVRSNGTPVNPRTYL